MDKHTTLWGERGWQPAYYAFVPSKKAWKKQMKKLGLKNQGYPTAHGHCFTAIHPKHGYVILVTISKKAEKHPTLEIIGLLTHEATHVFEFICDNMGEKNPSSEFTAYAMQAITQTLIQAYEKTRGKLLV